MAYVGIAFNAKRKSGKSWSANVALTDFPHIFSGIYSFADAARKLYADKIGVDISVLKDTTTKEIYRPAFIQWCDMRRAEDPDVFVREWLASLPKKESWLCDDLRYPNEFGAVAALNGVGVRINSPLNLRVSRGFQFTVGVDDHGTECALDSYSYFEEPQHKLANTESEYYNKSAVNSMVLRLILGGMHV